ncbi:GerW family sporulation protein [Methanothermobacter sp. K4]|uniref:GerW family sporulation protein n=1 Tax=Methanothermobacter sp. K4 TaxID=2913262 RepID=UPI001EDC7EA8|nr:spore germination protein GerW family protein [Methanothermobacter sp. K4]MCG2828613.1 sporulation protein [Methanothermobacter sp. K4]
MKIEEPIKTTVEELRKLLDVKNLVGEAIETEDKVLIPLMKMGVGFGAGMGEGTSSESEGGSGSGAGAAAGAEPVAMIVLLKGVEGPEGVRVIDLRSGSTGRIIQELGSTVTDIIREISDKGEPETESEE